jgi:hypothetical protein
MLRMTNEPLPLRLPDARGSTRLRNGNYRHGFYTAEAIAERRVIRALIGNYKKGLTTRLRRLP